MLCAWICNGRIIEESPFILPGRRMRNKRSERISEERIRVHETRWWWCDWGQRKKHKTSDTLWRRRSENGARFSVCVATHRKQKNRQEMANQFLLGPFFIYIYIGLPNSTAQGSIFRIFLGHFPFFFYFYSSAAIHISRGALSMTDESWMATRHVCPMWCYAERNCRRRRIHKNRLAAVLWCYRDKNLFLLPGHSSFWCQILLRIIVELTGWNKRIFSPRRRPQVVGYVYITDVSCIQITSLFPLDFFLKSIRT